MNLKSSNDENTTDTYPGVTSQIIYTRGTLIINKKLLMSSQILYTRGILTINKHISHAPQGSQKNWDFDNGTCY